MLSLVAELPCPGVRANLRTVSAVSSYAAAVSVEPALDVRRFTRAEYERLVEQGVFENERVELLRGFIVRMSPKGPAHDSAIDRLHEQLLLALRGRARVRSQSAFAASNGSEPEPDVAVVPPGEYRNEHPSMAFLIVEVADSSLQTDRTTKARIYAESGVEEYWIVNIRNGLIEVHTDIVDGAYTRITPFARGSQITLRAFPDVSIGASDVL